MNKTINDLKARIGDAEKKINSLRDQLDNEYTKILMEKHKLSDDSVIVCNGKKYIFAGFKSPSSIADIMGYPIKKDGSISNARKILYRNWAKEAG